MLILLAAFSLPYHIPPIPTSSSGLDSSPEKRFSLLKFHSLRFIISETPALSFSKHLASPHMVLAGFSGCGDGMQLQKDWPCPEQSRGTEEHGFIAARNRSASA